ncbi:Gtp-Binding Protein Rheb [Manis pentadactyla]|nr:Gtp-Binding Protein Rheb [Manis pentadactyla]
MPQSKSRKIAILGYRSVGKSSLTIQFVEGQFVDSYDPTIENTFTKLITVNGQEYHLQLVDTAGQDEYSIFPQTYSIDINGYILVYSVTSIKSFEVIKVIHGKLLDMVGKVQIPIMLVGNKKDLHMERVISYEEGKALAESWNAAFLESSAKENQTAVDVFRRIILEAEKIDGAASQGKSSCSLRLLGGVCGSSGIDDDSGFLQSCPLVTGLHNQKGKMENQQTHPFENLFHSCLAKEMAYTLKP